MILLFGSILILCGCVSFYSLSHVLRIFRFQLMRNGFDPRSNRKCIAGVYYLVVSTNQRLDGVLTTTTKGMRDLFLYIEACSYMYVRTFRAHSNVEKKFNRSINQQLNSLTEPSRRQQNLTFWLDMIDLSRVETTKFLNWIFFPNWNSNGLHADSDKLNFSVKPYYGVVIKSNRSHVVRNLWNKHFAVCVFVVTALRHTRLACGEKEWERKNEKKKNRSIASRIRMQFFISQMQGLMALALASIARPILSVNAVNK